MFNLFSQPAPIPPQLGQESVWDYPRPPRLEDVSNLIEIFCNGVAIAHTTKAKRVLETSHPPVYYIPTDDIAMEYLIRAEGTSFCEWKGIAVYYSVKVIDKLLEKVAWSYPEPTEAFSGIKGYIAFYPQNLDCYVNGEKVIPQPGGFYGGWVTSDIVGPFKGDRNSMGWQKPPKRPTLRLIAEEAENICCKVKQRSANRKLEKMTVEAIAEIEITSDQAD